MINSDTIWALLQSVCDGVQKITDDASSFYSEAKIEIIKKVKAIKSKRLENKAESFDKKHKIQKDKRDNIFKLINCEDKLSDCIKKQNESKTGKNENKNQFIEIQKKTTKLIKKLYPKLEWELIELHKDFKKQKPMIELKRI